MFTIVNHKFGRIRLNDGSVLMSRVAIVDVKKVKSEPPFGVDLAVRVMYGVALIDAPNELKERVADKPLLPPDRAPEKGWEFVDIVEQEPAFEEAEVVVDSTRRFTLRVESEAVMVARNLEYRSELGEPVYVVRWVNKVRWSPVEGRKTEERR